MKHPEATDEFRHPGRFRVVVGVITAGLALAFLLLLFAKGDPSHNGRSLREWARQHDEYFRQRGDPRYAEAEAAIQAIGTNAIPYFLAKMRTENSPLKSKFQKLTPDSVRRHFGWDVFPPQVGAHGLSALGTNAGAVVPDLIEIARTHAQPGGRYLAVWTLGHLRSAARPAIPFLIECLTNEMDIIRCDAAYGLGYIQSQPEVVVPALIDYLAWAKENSPDDGDIFAALGALTWFGTKANSAAPLVRSLFNDSNPSVRQNATNALARIERQADVSLPLAR